MLGELKKIQVPTWNLNEVMTVFNMVCVAFPGIGLISSLNNPFPLLSLQNVVDILGSPW